ncbi:MAG: DDE-type integrase/transposase/recombinase [Anaerolineae bacterium]|nr:DDE-type integrase/transposase/recombinase [Anaerolineae bacterium]
MALRIRAIHEARPPDLRHPRVHAELRESGEQAGKHRVARLMTHMGLKTRCRRRFRVTTQANAQRTPAPILLAQDFSATRPNQKWLVDITDLATREGWLYLAGVLDTYSRRIVGWSMSERLTEPLVCDALCMALAQGGCARSSSFRPRQPIHRSCLFSAAGKGSHPSQYKCCWTLLRQCHKKRASGRL